MRRLAALLCLLAAPAAANDYCDDVWFTRNLLFDRAGYCFGSTLGQWVFNNGDCVGDQVTLGAAAQAQLDEIKSREVEFGCKVDTSRTSLDLDDIDIRRRLDVLPIVDELAAGCIGWREPETPLYAGPDHASAVIGRIEPGDYLSFGHFGLEGWSYVTARDTGWRLKSGGWLSIDMDEESCVQWAG